MSGKYTISFLGGSSDGFCHDMLTENRRDVGLTLMGKSTKAVGLVMLDMDALNVSCRGMSLRLRAATRDIYLLNEW